MDDDGKTDDWFSTYYYSITVHLPEGTYQSIVKEIWATPPEDDGGSDGQPAEPNDEDYSTGSVVTKLGGLYKYRITIRTGLSYLDDIILYDSIEKYYMTPTGDMAKTESDWFGTFVDVDVSHADNYDGILHVEVYYTSHANPGPLLDSEGNVNTNEWSFYSRSINTPPEDVQSLAFRFLKMDGANHTLKPNAEVSVFITMRAPEKNNDPNKIAQNGAWTSWSTIGINGIGIPGEAGMNAQRVSISLQEGGFELPSSGSTQLVVVWVSAGALATTGLFLSHKKKKHSKNP